LETGVERIMAQSLTEGSEFADFVLHGCRQRSISVCGAIAFDPADIGQGYSMSFNIHPTAELRLEYRDGLCSAGAALAVATHFALCPQCAETQQHLGAWGGRNLPGVFAANHGLGGQAYADALGKQVLEAWRDVGDDTRIATVKGLGGLGEAVYLIETAAGAAMIFPAGVRFVVVLQGLLTDGPVTFERGAFIDLTALPLWAPASAGSHACICLVVCETA
jgi:hypothetical protein